MSRASTRGVAYAAAVLACAVAGILAAAAPAAHRKAVVRTAHSTVLRSTILVDRSGRTLYHLSVEKNGRFICTDAACLSFWHPLVVPKGVTPTGVVGLATVKRPDGRLQVTYRGGPLYRFAQDAKKGDAKGEGFKDVGVWHAAVVGKAAAKATPPTGGYGRHF